MANYREEIQNVSRDLIESAFDIVDSIGSYGLKGNKKLFSGYHVEHKVINRKVKEGSRTKRFYAKDHNFWKKNNQLPPEYENKIICADSSKLLKNLPDKRIEEADLGYFWEVTTFRGLSCKIFHLIYNILKNTCFQFGGFEFEHST